MIEEAPHPITVITKGLGSIIFYLDKSEFLSQTGFVHLAVVLVVPVVHLVDFTFFIGKDT